MSAFAEMIESCAGWAIAFLIVLGIAGSMGLNGSLLQQVRKNLSKLGKAIDEAQAVAQSNPKLIPIRLTRVTFYTEKADSLIKLYQYDHGSSGAIASAAACINAAGTACQEAGNCISEDDIAGIHDKLETCRKAALDADQQIVKALSGRK